MEFLSQKAKDWLDKKKNSLEDEYIGYGYSGEDLEKMLKKESKNLDDYVQRVYDLVTKKDKKEMLVFYGYFENLSNNKITAFLFKEFTGINTGTTNKDGIKAFNSYFGMETEIEIEKSKQIEKDKKEALLQKEKDDKNNEIKTYFSNPLWNIQGFSNLQLGRVIKSLNQEFNFTNINKILSLKDYIENHIECINKHKTNNMHKWNSRKYNQMDSEEQRDYDKKLENGRTHYIGLANNKCFEIPKIVFDILSLKDTTNYENFPEI